MYWKFRHTKLYFNNHLIKHKMQHSGLVNRVNYDPKVLSVFEIIGCYFVDTFYNSLFLKAREKTQIDGARSITDAYKSNIINYLRGVKNDTELYKHVVKQLCEYFRSATRYSTITFGEFEDKTVRCFIPHEYFNDLTERDKDSLLNVIVLRIVEDFSIKVIKQEYLKMIIDDHSNRGNIEVLKNVITDIMVLIRESYFERFMKKIVDNGRNDRDKIDVELLHKANKALVEELKTRVKLESEVASAKNVITGLLTKLKTLEVERDAAMSARDAANRELDLKLGEIRALQLASKQRTRGRPRKPTYDDSSDDEPMAPITTPSPAQQPQQNKIFTRDSFALQSNTSHNLKDTISDIKIDSKLAPSGSGSIGNGNGSDTNNVKYKQTEVDESASGSESSSESESESGDEPKPTIANFDFAMDDIGFGM